MSKQKKECTYNKIKDIIESGGNQLISKEYKNYNEKLKIKCNKCGGIYTMTFASYIKSRKMCQQCSHKERAIERRISIDIVKELIKKRGDIFIKSEYISNNLKLYFKCGKCNKQFDMLYNSYRDRKQCFCEKKGRKINYEFVKTYIEKQGDILISDMYISSMSKLNIKCQKCDMIYKITWTYYQTGSRCNLCKISRKKTYDEVSEYISKQGDALISQKYNNSKSKLEIRCGKCQNVYNMGFCEYLNRNQRCFECGRIDSINKRRLPYNYIKKFIQKYGDILVSKSYKNSRTNLNIKCYKCKKIYHMSFGNYKIGHRCTCDKLSTGERLVKNYLDNIKIKYTQQRKFRKCKDIRELSFDFYIKDYNLLVEFDGEQHFKENDMFGGKQTFIKQQKHDLIKNIYVKKHKIRLLRICYKDIKNINQILDNYLEIDNHEKIEYSNKEVYKNLIKSTENYLKI